MPESQRPGGPASLLDLYKDVFEVPTVPSVGREKARHLVLLAMREKGVSSDQMFLSDQLVRRGALFDASGKRVAFPAGEAYERCFVALVDPTPEARWGHPAYFAFVPAEGGAAVEVLPTLLPEHAGSSVRLLLVPSSDST